MGHLHTRLTPLRRNNTEQTIPDHVDIVDYKTDLSDHAEEEYTKQLSIYYHVVVDRYPDRSVSASIFYTDDGDRSEIEPLSKSELKELVRTH